LPTGHREAVERLDPAGHAYPARHSPSHWGVSAPTLAPNRPGLHRPLQSGDERAWVAPKRPAAHWEHTPAASKAYDPSKHGMAVGDVLPGPQAWPALQGPLQLALARPEVLPNRPSEQSVQTDAPGPLYRPAGHSTASGVREPIGHA
jgi:hypothetical protein